MATNVKPHPEKKSPSHAREWIEKKVATNAARPKQKYAAESKSWSR